MAVNRFFKPVDYEYTPIPFQELVTLGKYYADERRLAEKDLASYIKQANEFTSLISKDVDIYNKTAFNDLVKQYINQAASNPSVMKDMSWRSGLQAAINSVDYGMLNKLKSSAEGAKAYDAAAKKLAMEGKLPPGWEPNYFDTYSTAESGVFNANPLAYETMGERVKPFLDNLKDSYLYTDGQYDYFGVDPSTIATQLEAFKSDILNNPSNQRDIQRYVNMGMSLENATNTVLMQANRAGLEFARRTRTINPFAQINAKVEAATRKLNGYGGANGANGWFTEGLTRTGHKVHVEGALQFIKDMMPVKYKEWSDIMTAAALPTATSEDQEAAKKAQKELQAAMEKVTYKDSYNHAFDSAAKQLGEIDKNEETGESVYTLDQAIYGSNAIAAKYGKTVGADQYEKIASRTRGLSNKEKETDFGKTRTISGANNLDLQVASLERITGFDVYDADVVNRVNNALKSGALGELIPTGNNYVMGIPSGDNSINFFGQNVAIDAKMVTPKKDKDGNVVENSPSGVTADDLLKLGAQLRVVKDPAYVQKTKKKGDFSDTMETSTVTGGSKEPRTYYILPVTNYLPSTGSGVDAHYLNQDILQTEVTGSHASKKQMENYYKSIIDD